MQYMQATTRQAFFPRKAMMIGLFFLLALTFFGAASAQPLGSFSGRVWNDINNDGLYDAAEPGVANVTLHMKRTDTGDILSAISDESGAFLFADLPNGSYIFSVEVPHSMLFARYRKEGGDLRSVLTGETNDISRTFVIRNASALKAMNVGLIDSAIVKGLTYLDVNYNGQYDDGEPPYSGVAMEVIRNASDRSVGKLKTDETGTFFFDTIRSGNYRLRAILPDDGSTFSKVPAVIGVFSNQYEARPGRRENSILSIDAENSMVYEYYVGVAIGGTISGTVFTDANYTGTLERSDRKLNGVQVALVSADGSITAETRTNSQGVYTFKEVMPGDYQVRFLRKEGYTFTKYRPLEPSGNAAQLTQAGDCGQTDVFSFTMGETLEDLNAGMVQSATIGGVFFDDSNDNGFMDEAEGGFTDGLVHLDSDDGEIHLTQSVNADGSYYFSGVVPTTYTLTFVIPEHSEMAKTVKNGNTVPHQGLSNTIGKLTVKAKKHYMQPLAGAVKLGTFEGYAFTDSNANGIRDDQETPLAGVTVSITANNSTQLPVSVSTGSDGQFSITGLRPDDYSLSITLPDGMIFASDISANDIALDASSTYSAPLPFHKLINRVSNSIAAVMPATVQASVWLDENRNNKQDPTERKLDALEYTLYDELHQQYSMTATSDSDGIVVFDNVRPSTYTLSFTLPATAQPVQGAGTFVQDGRIMRHSGILVSQGDTITPLSAGITSTTSLGGTITVNQAGSQRPVGGISVMLYAQGDNQPQQTVLSNAQGVYRFDGLWPDTYTIEAAKPAGYVFVKPGDTLLASNPSIISQITETTGISHPIALFMANDLLSNDIQLTIPAKIGNLAWLDTNTNGLIDGTEPMLNGVTIRLLQNGTTKYTTTTNEWGYYEFADVYPGDYILEAVAYPELAITTPVTSLPMISSCLVSGDGTLAQSEPFTVTSASVNFNHHLGYLLKDGAQMPPAVTEGSHQIWPQP